MAQNVPKPPKAHRLAIPENLYRRFIINSFVEPGLSRSQVNAACKSCHMAPGSNLGGFTYADAYQSQNHILNEQPTLVPGFYESAEQMRDAFLQGTMPPANIREKNPEAYIALGQL